MRDFTCASETKSAKKLGGLLLLMLMEPYKLLGKQDFQIFVCQ